MEPAQENWLPTRFLGSGSAELKIIPWMTAYEILDNAHDRSLSQSLLVKELDHVRCSHERHETKQCQKVSLKVIWILKGCKVNSPPVNLPHKSLVPCWIKTFRHGHVECSLAH